MRPQVAKSLLIAWASGAYVSTELIQDAICVLVHGEPVPFVEDCFKRRYAFEGRPWPPSSPSSPNTPSRGGDVK